LRAPTPLKISNFISQFKSLHLAFEQELHAAPGDRVAHEFDQAIRRHFSANSLRFASSTSQQVTTDDELQWTFLVSGKSQRVQHLGPLLKVISSTPTNAMTHALLQKESRKFPVLAAPNDHFKLVFVIPLYSIIVGPLNGDDNVHYCLAIRAWDRQFTAAVDEATEDPECHPSCSGVTFFFLLYNSDSNT
jgi:hypothetical protein